MAKKSLWQLYIPASKRTAHRHWFETGRTGPGRIDIEGKNLTRAAADGAYLQGARFFKCDLSESDISSGNLRDAEIFECVWDDALLSGARFDRAIIEDSCFVGAYLGLSNFSETKIRGGNWSQSDLHRSAWIDAWVENVCFQKANFQGIRRLRGTHFIGCDFREANLLLAIPQDTVFERCDFRGAYLDELILKNTVFKECAFYGCIGIPELEGDCQIIKADLSEEFDNTNTVTQEQMLAFWGLENNAPKPEVSIFSLSAPQWEAYIGHEHQTTQAQWVNKGCAGPRPMNVKEKNLSRAFAYEAYFIAARFTKCDFAASDLRRARVQQAEFINCIFDEALLMYLEARQEVHMRVPSSQALFQDCQVRKAHLNRSELEKLKIIGGDWSDSEFNNCIWHFARVENVCFRGSNWRWADLRDSHFIGCDFTGADLTETNLVGVTFERCHFREANFDWPKVRKTTFSQCGFKNAKGNVFDYGTEEEERSRVIEPDLSEAFDGTEILESIDDLKQLFYLLDDRQKPEAT